ncbi:MAG: PKD domain-containing protein, partial [Anaerolineae bacterium]|nr:PKD domain-containing protein [Anaerolineae bacterium]
TTPGGILAPVAHFSATPTSGEVPLTVSFTDQSTNMPTSWLWDFGDAITSTLQHPAHSYITPGTYNVTLTATNAAGTDSEMKSNLITVGGECKMYLPIVLSNQ